jgi:hypothetical protein
MKHFTPQCWKNFKIDSEEKREARGGGHIIMMISNMNLAIASSLQTSGFVKYFIHKISLSN